MFERERENLWGLVAPALVIVASDVRSPLWDPALLALVEYLEGRLDGVFVTCAVTGSRQPTVADALSASKAMGCRSAVVVDLPGSETTPRFMLSGIPFAVTRSTGEAAQIAAAYREAVNLPFHAACA